MTAVMQGRVDAFNGVIIDVASLPPSADSFDAALGASLAAWRAEGRRAIWLTLPLSLASHVPAAVRHGFEHHHVQDGSLVLSTWLQAEPDKRPGYASHFVGVGGAVLNSRNELLLVREKYVHTDLWKLPGGISQPGEDIGAAAVREVREETGLQTTFEGIFCYRQMPNARMGAGDLYFVCSLRPVDEQQPLVAEESEIAECKWIPLDQYRQLKLPSMMRHIAEALAAKAPVARPVAFPLFDGRPQFFYENPGCTHQAKL